MIDSGNSTEDIPLLFGRFLALKGLITDEELRDAITIQLQLNHYHCDAYLLLGKGLLDLEDVQRCRDYQMEKGRTLHEALLDLKLIETSALEFLQHAERPQLRLGEILVRRGSLSQQELQKALADFQKKNFL
jgi:hypothetical protein